MLSSTGNLSLKGRSARRVYRLAYMYADRVAMVAQNIKLVKDTDYKKKPAPTAGEIPVMRASYYSKENISHDGNMFAPNHEDRNARTSYDSAQRTAAHLNFDSFKPGFYQMGGQESAAEHVRITIAMISAAKNESRR